MQGRGISKGHRGQGLGFNFQHRNVGIRIGTDDFCFEHPLVREHHLHAVGVIDDMVVGYDVSVRFEDYARSEGVLPLLAWDGSRRKAEELPQGGVHKHRGLLGFHNVFGADVDDGRRAGLDDSLVRFVLALQHVDVRPG